MSDETKNHTNEGKGKEKDRKRREKSDGCTPTFSWQHWRLMLFEQRKLLDGRGLFGSNLFKNSAKNSSNNIATSLRVC